MGDLAQLSDEALLDRFQRAAFGYFLEHVNPDNGLVADTSAGLAGQHRGRGLRAVMLSGGSGARLDAARGCGGAHTRGSEFLLETARKAMQPDATGYKGFYYHFLDMKTGKRVWQCELSLIDTTLLLAGVLVAGGYFDEAGDEAEIRELGRCDLSPHRLAMGAVGRPDRPAGMEAGKRISSLWLGGL